MICTFLICFIYSIHIIQVFSFVCVLTWSLLGGKKSLGHAQIGLLQWFNSKFPTSIPRFHMRSPHPPGFEIGDEFHYLLKCTHSSLSHTRDIFLESLYSINSNFTNTSCKALFLYINCLCPMKTS